MWKQIENWINLYLTVFKLLIKYIDTGQLVDQILIPSFSVFILNSTFSQIFRMMTTFAFHITDFIPFKIER